MQLAGKVILAFCMAVMPIACFGTCDYRIYLLFDNTRYGHSLISLLQSVFPFSTKFTYESRRRGKEGGVTSVNIPKRCYDFWAFTVVSRVVSLKKWYEIETTLTEFTTYNTMIILNRNHFARCNLKGVPGSQMTKPMQVYFLPYINKYL